MFVTDGPGLLTEAEREVRVRVTETAAGALEELAEEAESRPVTYAAFQERLGELQALAAMPRADLVSAVAFWLRRSAATPADANAVPESLLESGCP